MSTTPINPKVGVPDLAATTPVAPVAASKPATEATPAAAIAEPDTPHTPNLDPADFQLVIEDDKAAGSLVYKTIDRRTGEIVSQFPRDQILRMREAFNYQAGAVISTKA